MYLNRFVIQALMILTVFHVSAQPVIVPAPLQPEIREQYVQEALRLRALGDYAGAIRQIDTILWHQHEDAPILLLKGDIQLQSSLYRQAVETYKQLLPLEYKKTISQINLSYALFKSHKPEKALRFAYAALANDSTNVNAIVNYFNSLLWNIKTKEAGNFLEQYAHTLSPDQRLVLQARLLTTSGDFARGLQYYDTLVTTYPDKYYVQEYADVLLGKKDIQQATKTLNDGKHFFSASEVDDFNRKLKFAQLQQAGTEFIYFKDIGKNIRIENSLWWQQKDGQEYCFGVKSGISSLSSPENQKTSTQFAHLHIDERWSKSFSGQTDLHVQRIQPGNSQSFIGITGKQLIQYQPNDRRMVSLFYESEVLNYTASLLERNIRSHGIGYVTHVLVGGKTGFYSHGSMAMLTDNNKRYQFFGSLYRLIRTLPTLKTGVDFSSLHFRDTSIQSYFSPDQYLNLEVFAEYSTPVPGLNRFELQVQGATGMQKIEHQPWESAWRLQADLGYHAPHFYSTIRYQTSNVASGTGTGYQFDWLTFRLAWKW